MKPPCPCNGSLKYVIDFKFKYVSIYAPKRKWYTVSIQLHLSGYKVADTLCLLCCSRASLPPLIHLNALPPLCVLLSPFLCILSCPGLPLPSTSVPAKLFLPLHGPFSVLSTTPTSSHSSTHIFMQVRDIDLYWFNFVLAALFVVYPSFLPCSFLLSFLHFSLPSFLLLPSLCLSLSPPLTNMRHFICHFWQKYMTFLTKIRCPHQCRIVCAFVVLPNCLHVFFVPDTCCLCHLWPCCLRSCFMNWVALFFLLSTVMASLCIIMWNLGHFFLVLWRMTLEFWKKIALNLKIIFGIDNFHNIDSVNLEAQNFFLSGVLFILNNIF